MGAKEDLDAKEPVPGWPEVLGKGCAVVLVILLGAALVGATGAVVIGVFRLVARLFP